MNCFVEVWLPIIQLIVVVLGGLAGLYKYYKEKNREVYEKVLAEVYAPLFQYFVKQELLRKLMHIESDYKDTPIIEVTSKTTKTTMTIGKTTQTISEPKPVLELSRDVFMDVLENINIGLAPKELFTLLNMYKVTIHVCGGSNKTSDSQLESAIMQGKIEAKLRKEIIKGYKTYHKKLGFKPGESVNDILITNDNIVFNIPICEDEKNKLKAKIIANPELYQ